MLNIENIISEYADARGLSYGKAESLFMVKLKVICQRDGLSMDEVLQRIEGMSNDETDKVIDAISAGNSIEDLIHGEPKNSVDTHKEVDYNQTIKNNSSNNGGPKMNTKEMLIELNEHRAALNMKPLKAWKESRAKLEDAINMLANKLDDQADKQPAPAPAPVAVPQTPEQKKVNRKLRDGMAPKKPAADAAPAGETVTIGQLCDKLSINPKVARAKLRRMNGKAELPAPISEGRWEWAANHTDALIALLK